MTAVRRQATEGMILLLGAVGLHGWAHTARPGQQGETTRYRVANVQVVHRVIEGSEVVAVRLYLLGGTRQVTVENAGVEALLLRANELERGRRLARTGSRSILEIGPDWSVLGFVGLHKDVDSAWAAFAELLDGPPQSADAIDRARGELLADAHRRYIQPDSRIQAMAREIAFAEHPYALEPHGTEESLERLTPADLERYWGEQFVTSRMLLVVVGDVSRAQVESLVTRALGGLPVGNYTWSLSPPVVQRPSTWRVEHRALPTSYLLGYVVGPEPGDRDYFPFRAAVALLSSQLAGAVRGRQALSYTAYAPFRDWARPVGGLYASTSNPSKVLVTMSQELADLTEARFRDASWHALLDQFTLDQLLKQMTSDGQADALARAQLYFDDLEMVDRYAEQLRRVGMSAVRRVAQRYFGNIQWAYLGDTTQMRGAW